MKLGLISDLHSHPGTLQLIEDIHATHQLAGLVCLGDIAQYGDDKFLNVFLGFIDKLKVPCFLIWGNNESKADQLLIQKSPHNSHLKLRTIGQEKIFGIGGFEEVEPFDPKILTETILLTHYPPNPATLSRSLPNAPKYHLSGHLHYRAYLKKYPAITHIQVPSLALGRYGIFDPERGKIKFF